MKSCSLILLSFAILLSEIVYAQDKNYDYTYLKNGSMIKGRIIELVPSGIVKIRMVDGSIFVYDMAEVEKLVFHTEDADFSNPKTQTARGNLSIGGSLLYDHTFSNGINTSLVNLTSSFGWFVADNFLLGLDVSYQGQTYTFNTFNGYYFGYETQWDWLLSVGPTFEIYFGSGLDKPFMSVFYLFSTNQYESSQALGFGLGYNIHLSRDIALQPIVQYQLLAPQHGALGKSTELSVGLGLRDFIL